MIALTLALAGALWRFWDGRGADSPILPAPGYVRLSVCFILAMGCLWPLGWIWAIPLAGAWTAMWTPRQKNREEFDDMALRWAVPIGGLFGLALMIATDSPIPLGIMGIAGLLVAAFVWASTKLRDLKLRIGSYEADSTAIFDVATGAVAFGALSVGVLAVG
jgi:hypothetical protein